MRLIKLLCGFFLLSMGTAQALDYKVETLGKLTSPDVPIQIREALQLKGVRMLEREEPLFELWLRDLIPEKTGSVSPDALYGTLRKGTWMGILHFPREGSDFRGQSIKPGYYSLRYQHVLQDGNHMGASVYPDFVALVPASLDLEIDKLLSFEQVINLSRKSSGTNHPAVMSLATASEGKTPEHPGLVQDDIGHWVLETGSNKKTEDSDKPVDFPFAIVLVGRAEA